MNHARHPFGPRAVSARSGNTDTGHRAIRMAFSSARAQGRCALITYLTLGYPSRAESLELIPALQTGGADIIELGVPFSDPVADGPTIQRASQAAIKAGMTPSGCLELAAQLREDGVTVPLVLMGYYNPLFSYGLGAYARDAASAGVDGLIIPDLPPEEAGPLQSACRNDGLALIFLVTPTSDKARIAKIAEATDGFLYVVSRLGTTGSGQIQHHDLSAQLEHVRQCAKTPIAVGFGISRPNQVRTLAPQVDGIIVGSAIVRKAREGAETLRQYVASLRAATRVSG